MCLPYQDFCKCACYIFKLIVPILEICWNPPESENVKGYINLPAILKIWKQSFAPIYTSAGLQILNKLTYLTFIPTAHTKNRVGIETSLKTVFCTKLCYFQQGVFLIILRGFPSSICSASMWKGLFGSFLFLDVYQPEGWSQTCTNVFIIMQSWFVILNQQLILFNHYGTQVFCTLADYKTNKIIYCVSSHRGYA